MIRICTALQAAGHSVLLVGRTLPGSPPLREQRFGQRRLRCHFHRGKAFYLEYNLRLLVFLLRHRADAINAVDLDTLLPGYLAARRWGVPCVYDAHEYFTEVPELVRRPRTQRMWEALADAIIPRLRYAYTVGPALADVLGQRYGIAFGVVRNVPLRRPSADPLPAADPKIILYQGMLNEGRGLETAIAAMPHLPGCVLWLAGHGDVADALRQQTQALGLADRVRFLGFVPPDALPALTRQAWLGLNLLESRAPSYYYSLANKAFDYIQAGVPSVQMNFPEYAALQAGYGPFVLLDALTVDALVAAIAPLLSDAAAYRACQRRCLAAAEDLHWDNEVGRLLAVYDFEESKI